MKSSALWNDLDKYLAGIGMGLSLILAGTLLLLSKLPSAAFFLGFTFFACLTYLIIRNRMPTAEITFTSDDRLSIKSILLVNILYFNLMSLAILLIINRSQIYQRPLAYFITIAILGMLLAVEILKLPRVKGYEKFVLIKIVLLGLVLRLVPFSMFPGNILFDPWSHEKFILDMLELGRIPDTIPVYSHLPGMHLLLGFTMLVTGLDFKHAFMLVGAPTQVVVLAGTSYLLIVRFISGERAGLLAALMITTADLVLAKGAIIYPNNFIMVFLYAMIYLVLYVKSKPSVKLNVLIWLAMGVIIITHSIGAMALSIVLACYWLGLEVHKRVYKNGSSTIPASYVFTFTLFSVTMLSWWMYVSGHLLMLSRVVKWAFEIDRFFPEEVTQQAWEYATSIPIVETLIDWLGFSFYISCAIVGSLHLLSPKSKGQTQGFVLVISGILILFIGFFGIALQILVASQRWLYMSEILLAVPAAVGFILIVNLFRERQALLVGVLMGGLTFFMITNSQVDFDNPIYAEEKVFRQALIQSELTPLETISDKWDGAIVGDFHVYAYYKPRRNPSLVSSIGVYLEEKDFSSLEDSIVVIRKYITTDPFFSIMVWKIEFDPADILKSQGYVQIYDSGSVQVFYNPLSSFSGDS